MINYTTKDLAYYIKYGGNKGAWFSSYNQRNHINQILEYIDSYYVSYDPLKYSILLNSNDNTYHLNTDDYNILSMAINRHGNISTIDFSSCEIGDNEIEAVANLIRNNKCISKVVLVCSYALSTNAVQTLVEALIRNGNIKHLDLEDSDLSEENGMILAEAISRMNKLSCLSLKDCEIDDNAGVALAHAVKVNKKISHVDLSGNDLSNRTAQAFAHTLKNCKHIKKLILDDNHIEGIGAEAILNALIYKSSTISVSLKDNDIPWTLIKQINKYASSTKNIASRAYKSVSNVGKRIFGKNPYPTVKIEVPTYNNTDPDEHYVYELQRILNAAYAAGQVVGSGLVPAEKSKKVKQAEYAEMVASKIPDGGFAASMAKYLKTLAIEEQKRRVALLGRLAESQSVMEEISEEVADVLIANSDIRNADEDAWKIILAVMEGKIKLGSDIDSDDTVGMLVKAANKKRIYALNSIEYDNQNFVLACKNVAADTKDIDQELTGEEINSLINKELNNINNLRRVPTEMKIASPSDVKPLGDQLNSKKAIQY